MDGQGYAKRFSELVVWKESRKLSRELFEASQSFPDEEKFSLTDQLRRSSRSIGAQIAEAWAKRRYERHFVSKLTDADGEQNETQHWLIVALDSGYMEKDAVCGYGSRCREIGAMLGKMIAVSHQFCGEFESPQSTVLRETEDITQFFTDSPITDY